MSYIKEKQINVNDIVIGASGTCFNSNSLYEIKELQLNGLGEIVGIAAVRVFSDGESCKEDVIYCNDNCAALYSELRIYKTSDKTTKVRESEPTEALQPTEENKNETIGFVMIIIGFLLVNWFNKRKDKKEKKKENKVKKVKKTNNNQ